MARIDADLSRVEGSGRTDYARVSTPMQIPSAFSPVPPLHIPNNGSHYGHLSWLGLDPGDSSSTRETGKKLLLTPSLANLTFCATFSDCWFFAGRSWFAISSSLSIFEKKEEQVDSLPGRIGKGGSSPHLLNSFRGQPYQPLLMVSYELP